ncbi:hypothetical protein OIV83_003252 [Microbotryomycetes sp. JL201]|nr:hypothetical protein OIV83_003252 [Microbotryomycetes sp. JL201]
MPVLELRPPSQSSSLHVRSPLSPSKQANGCALSPARSVNTGACTGKRTTMTASSSLSSIEDTSSMYDGAAYGCKGKNGTEEWDARRAGRANFLQASQQLACGVATHQGKLNGSNCHRVLEDDDMDLQSGEDGTGSTRRTSLDTTDMMLARSISKTSLASRESIEDDGLPVLHVEVRLKPNSAIRNDTLQRQVANWLRASFDSFDVETEARGWQDVDLLNKHVDRVWLGECTADSSQNIAVAASAALLEIHVYSPPSSSRAYDVSTSEGDDYETGNDDDNVPAASVLHLPNRALDGLWNTLVYEDDVKTSLLSYIYSTVLFSDAMVDFNVVTWNRVVLLHGPPGTGKTSLCRALAQKLAIRLSSRYDSGKLVEINSHSLFSKWFSESGKLVQRLFSAVTEMVDDESCFVVVLIDEVESLTTARAGAMSGREPSDALRVVNALLTQLDKLKTRKNVLVVTTSNLSDAIGES